MLNFLDIMCLKNIKSHPERPKRNADLCQQNAFARIKRMPNERDENFMQKMYWYSFSFIKVSVKLIKMLDYYWDLGNCTILRLGAKDRIKQMLFMYFYRTDHVLRRISVKLFYDCQYGQKDLNIFWEKHLWRA